MDFGIAFLFVGGGLLNSFCWWNATRGMIKRIGINWKLYPKHYVTPSRHIKKLFGINKHKIPRYLCYMCYATVIYFFLGPAELVIYYCVDDAGYVAGWVLLIHCFYVIANAFVFLIMSTLFNKNK